MRLVSVSKRFGDKVALDIDELSFEKDMVYAVMGANGSGKTTLARIIAGLLKPDAGRIEGNRSVRLMPQKSYAFYGSVRKNIAMGAGRGQEAYGRVDALVSALDLESVAESSAKKVSGGELGRMALARTLAGDADFLILDEPTASLDISSTLQAEKLVGEYRARTHAGIIVITHSAKQASRIADNLVFLDKGRVVEQGDAASAFRNPQSSELEQFLAVFGR